MNVGGMTVFLLKNEIHETIWGGGKLAPFAGSTSSRIGHLYSVNCNAEGSNTILTGPYRGRTLNAYFDENKARFGLAGYEYFPVVIALVEARDHLSIQVHPDDATAMLLDATSRGGKNESWFFIDAPESGEIFCGCRAKTMVELKDAILTDRMESATDRLRVQKGDYVFVKAGTLHAMSRGSLVYEIEENAGCTYRFYDFDRTDSDGKKRPLQIPEAFFSIRLGNKSVAKQYGDAPIEERRYFTQHYARLEDYRNESQTLQVLTILSGEAEIEGHRAVRGTSVVLEPGDELHITPVEAMVAEMKGM